MRCSLFSHTAKLRLLLLVQPLTSRLLLQPAPTGGNAGTCNANMPNNSVYTRFLYVIKVSPIVADLVRAALSQSRHAPLGHDLLELAKFAENHWANFSNAAVHASVYDKPHTGSHSPAPCSFNNHELGRAAVVYMDEVDIYHKCHAVCSRSIRQPCLRTGASGQRLLCADRQPPEHGQHSCGQPDWVGDLLG